MLGSMYKRRRAYGTGKYDILVFVFGCGLLPFPSTKTRLLTPYNRNHSELFHYVLLSDSLREGYRSFLDSPCTTRARNTLEVTLFWWKEY